MVALDHLFKFHNNHKGLLHYLLLTLILLHAATAMTLNSIPKSNVRIELFFKGKKDLTERIQLLSNHGVSSFNLVNKSRQDNLEEWVETIREELPDCSVCAHYSLKFNKSPSRIGKDDASYNMLTSFLQSDPIACNNIDKGKGFSEVLLVSGSGEKAKLDPINVLQRLQNDGFNNLPAIAVAYNPFFPSKNNKEVERERLIQKLESGQVNKVYLQFGTDLEILQSSLKFLSEVREEYNISISGSIFLPTKKLIAQQKFRPWNGVFLSGDFLSSPDNAYQIVLRMMKLYKEYDCEILIEAPGVRNEKDMALVEQLLQERDTAFAETKSGMLPLIPQQIDQSNGDMNNLSIKRRKIATNINLSPSAFVSSKSLEKPAILLFGSHDVRIHDNQAFLQASFHNQVIPVFLWDKRNQGKWGVTGALEIVLKDALRSLNKKFQNHGLELICRNTAHIGSELLSICEVTGAEVVYFNSEHVTESRVREEEVANLLNKKGIVSVPCQSSLLYDPRALSLSGGFNGGHWGTLMPFLKACKKQLGEPRRPCARHDTFSLLESMQGLQVWPDSIDIEALDIGVVKGNKKWDLPILERFPMSEDVALQELEHFMKKGFFLYEQERSRADLEYSTSKLSPHLRIGTLSPNELYYKVEDSSLSYDERKTFSRRLVWRDLAYYHLLNFPTMRDISIRCHYGNSKWCDGEEENRRFEAWKTGTTGYPLVDAGMRELYKTGWLTQSVRMVVASFLTEYLRVNWVKGCEWFHYTLVDSDSAINAMMWQNAGRSGIDQWNFVMSPVAASQDQTGAYTHKWVPELSRLDKPLLHKPWEAPEEVLSQAGIELGNNYPHRIVTDLKGERELSVENVLQMRRNAQEYNDKKGYDLISLPSGHKTVVFTKKEYRIDEKGVVIPTAPMSRKTKKKVKKVGRGRKGRQSVGGKP